MMKLFNVSYIKGVITALIDDSDTSIHATGLV